MDPRAARRAGRPTATGWSTCCTSSPTTASGSCSSPPPTTAATACRSAWRPSQADWDRLIEEHAERGDYVVQEYVPVPEEMFPTVEDGHVQMRLKRFNINPFGIGGRYAGHDHPHLRPGRDQRVGRRRPAAERGGPPRGGCCAEDERRMRGGSSERALTLGYDVDDNAARFSNYFHVLRELVHLHERLAPARAELAAQVRARRPRPRRRPRADEDQAPPLRAAQPERLSRLAPRRSSSELLDRHGRSGLARRLPRGRVRRGEAGAGRRDAESSSTTSTRWRTSRRCGCSPGRGASGAALAELAAGRRRPRRHRRAPAFACARRRAAPHPAAARPSPRATRSSRSPTSGDPYLSRELYVNGAENHVPTEPEEQRHFFHGLMDAELSAAELMARNSHEHPEMPWDFHVDMARQTWDELRHAKPARPADEGGARLRMGRLPGRLLLLQVDLRATTCSAACASSTARASSGDVAPLAPAQGADGAGPGARGAGVRLPARRRGTARAQRRALGRAPARRRARAPTATRCASCAPRSTRRARRPNPRPPRAPSTGASPRTRARAARPPLA